MSNNLPTNFDKKFYAATTLDKAEADTDYVIISNNLSKPLQIRFAELGFVAGTKIRVINKAPMGDPLQVTLMGYSLCARSSELKHISVKRANDD